MREKPKEILNRMIAEYMSIYDTDRQGAIRDILTTIRVVCAEEGLDFSRIDYHAEDVFQAIQDEENEERG